MHMNIFSCLRNAIELAEAHVATDIVTEKETIRINSTVSKYSHTYQCYFKQQFKILPYHYEIKSHNNINFSISLRINISFPKMAVNITKTDDSHIFSIKYNSSYSKSLILPSYSIFSIFDSEKEHCIQLISKIIHIHPYESIILNFDEINFKNSKTKNDFHIKFLRNIGINEIYEDETTTTEIGDISSTTEYDDTTTTEYDETITSEYGDTSSTTEYDDTTTTTTTSEYGDTSSISENDDTTTSEYNDTITTEYDDITTTEYSDTTTTTKYGDTTITEYDDSTTTTSDFDDITTSEYDDTTTSEYNDTTTEYDTTTTTEYKMILISLSDDNKHAYTYNIDIPIHIKGSVIDYVAIGTINVTLLIDDDFVELKQIAGYYTNFNFSIQNADKYLSEGIHYYSVLAKDEPGNTATASSFFTLNYSTPIVTIQNQNYSTLKKNINKSIQLDLKIIDNNAPCDITIYYELLNITQQKTTSISSAQKQFDLPIDIPQDLEENNYTIYIWVSDKFHQSVRKSFDFNFEYNVPTLSLSPNNKKIHYSDHMNPLVISGTIANLDGTGTVTVKLTIENIKYVSSKIITINDTNTYPYEFDIYTKSYKFEEKMYNYNVIAYGENSKYSSIESSYFHMKFYQPSFSIIEPTDKLTIRKSLDKNFKIKYSITNHDYPCSIHFYYTINRGNISLLDTIQMESYELNNQIIQYRVPDSINTGIYNLTIFVTNDIPKSSSPSIIQYEVINSNTFRFPNFRLMQQNGTIRLLFFFIFLI